MTSGMSAKGSALGASVPEGNVPSRRAPARRTSGVEGNGAGPSHRSEAGRDSQEAGISPTPATSAGSTADSSHQALASSVRTLILGIDYDGRIVQHDRNAPQILAGRQTVSALSSAQYGESLAGVRGETPFHQFQVDLSPKDAAGKLLPEISAAPAGEPGSADRKVQAYNFRMILSHDPANQVAYPKPAHYDPARFELFARLLDAMQKKQGRPSRLGEVLSVIPVPNHKADINNNGAFSTDYIGKSWDYPNATYARREEIWRDHEEYTKELFWFLAHDPRVPPSLQKEANEWGLAKDEFLDTDHWPNQLYIREARRMVGEYVMSQKDIQTELTKPDPIGMGSYNSDSHNVQRVINKDGFVRNEGDMQVPVQPYQIPYRVLLPKKNEVQNLLVPVCFSATHVAYSTLRMEPQYMILGQAAGVAAAMAIRRSLRRAGYRYRGADPHPRGTRRHPRVRARPSRPRS